MTRMETSYITCCVLDVPESQSYNVTIQEMWWDESLLLLLDTEVSNMEMTEEYQQK